MIATAQARLLPGMNVTATFFNDVWKPMELYTIPRYMTFRVYIDYYDIMVIRLSVFLVLHRMVPLYCLLVETFHSQTWNTQYFLTLTQ